MPWRPPSARVSQGSRADSSGPAAGQAKRPEEGPPSDPGHERPTAEVGAPQAVAVAPCLALGGLPRRLACLTSMPALSAEDRSPSRDASAPPFQRHFPSAPPHSVLGASIRSTSPAERSVFSAPPIELWAHAFMALSVAKVNWNFRMITLLRSGMEGATGAWSVRMRDTASFSAPPLP